MARFPSQLRVRLAMLMALATLLVAPSAEATAEADGYYRGCGSVFVMPHHGGDEAGLCGADGASRVAPQPVSEHDDGSIARDPRPQPAPICGDSAPSPDDPVPSQEPTEALLGPPTIDAPKTLVRTLHRQHALHRRVPSPDDPRVYRPPR